MVKTKILKRRLEIKLAKKKHNLIRCKCRDCGKKKWTQHNKKSSKVICLTIINLIIWTIAIDGITNWYAERGVCTFTQAAGVTPKEKGQESIKDSAEAPITEPTLVSTQPVSVVSETEGNAHTVYPVTPETAGTLKKIASKYDIDWKILYAICKKESNCNSERVGDGGKSLGAFQIHTGYHPTITKEQATDFSWSAEWTAKRLKRYAYLGESEMIRSHNGLVPNNANGYYVEDVYKIMETL